MSSSGPSARKHYPRTTPRNFTEEQIWFVLALVRTHSNREIMVEFNRHFEGVRTLELKHVKYIRTSYGNDPNWGAPNIVMPLGPTPPIASPSMPGRSNQVVTRDQGQSFNDDSNNRLPIVQPENDSTEHTSLEHISNTFGANTNVNINPNLSQYQQSGYPPSPMLAFDTQARQSQQANRFQPRSLMPEPDFTYIPVLSTWHEGTHDDCELNAQHRHEENGAVSFPSTAAVMQMMRRSQPSAPPRYIEEMMESIRAHTIAMNELQATMLKALVAKRRGVQPSAAPGSSDGSEVAVEDQADGEERGERSGSW